ncbi:hypothetical protein DFH11DRAFT_1768712 [Phellopilus nigrolimitatus]|nr:hypothetical protein DFH11DRAFT_1768712 [Phellopilus nigrolimitatus]
MAIFVLRLRLDVSTSRLRSTYRCLIIMQQQQIQQQQQRLHRNLSHGSIKTILRSRAQSRGSAGEDRQQPSTLVRTRTVINQLQTPLYCSEACPKKDLEWSWPMPMSNAQSAQLATKTKSHWKDKRVSLAAHPAQLNPAHVLRDLCALDLGATALPLARSNSSTSSSAIGTHDAAVETAAQLCGSDKRVDEPFSV